MPRFFFHLTNGNGYSPDTDGLVLSGAAAARCYAITSIRNIVADEAKSGVIDLTGHIDIKNDNDEQLDRIGFGEAFLVSTGQLRSAYGSERQDGS